MSDFSALQFRPAVAGDYSVLERIAEANSFDKVSAAQRPQGFLTGHFTAARFAEIAQSLALIVADDGGTPGGFMCATQTQDARSRPIIAALLAACATIEFQDKLFGRWRTFIYGPVCVAEAYRGRGVLKGLFAALKPEVTHRFEVGVGFVDQANPGSLRAHVQGLGMKVAGQFNFNGRGYHIIAFDCRS